MSNISPALGNLSARLQQAIIDVPDFPKPGIIFKDLCPVLQDPALLADAVRELGAYARCCHATAIAGIEARGFFYAAPLAVQLGLPLIPVRKKGKLPGEVYEECYDLEYGSNSLVIQQLKLGAANRVFLVDDLLATGGTAQAACRLIERTGARVCGLAFLVELSFLEGRARLPAVDVFTLTSY